MTGFIVVGAVGLVLVLASLVLDDLLGGLFEAFELDAGGGLLSTPVIGSFLAALGFGGALVMSATGGGVGVGLAGGLVAGALLGYGALRITRAVLHMPTDENVRVADLVGRSATVVSAIPDGGYGQVRLVHLGQRLQLNARAAGTVPAGTAVVITQVTSTSSVLVEPEDTFFGGALESGA